jgi:hypothetical protein
MIAYLRKIQKANLEPRFQRSAFSVDCVEMPIDFWTVLDILVSQETKAMLKNSVRLTDKVPHIRT